jgi:uncharacterized alkaline shock family protein YloU
MTDSAPRGRSLVSRRAIKEIVRGAVLGSYGVTGFVDDGPRGRLRRLVGRAGPGITVTVRPRLTVDLRLTVAYGLPVAEVARQVDSAVRYALRRALDQEPETVAIHVGGLHYETASTPDSPR